MTADNQVKAGDAHRMNTLKEAITILHVFRKLDVLEQVNE